MFCNIVEITDAKTGESLHGLAYQTAYLFCLFAFGKQHADIEECTKIEQAYYRSFATDINDGSKL